MIDRAKFMETLRSVAEVAKVSEEPLTKEEIISYFDDIELTDEQTGMIFEYLKNTLNEDNKNTKVLNQENISDQGDISEESSQQMDAFTQALDNSKFLVMYLEDLAAIQTLTTTELQEMYRRLLDGEEMVMSRISDDWLMRVVEIAKTYVAHQVNIEDIIQEGNIGLILGMQQLLGTKKSIDVEEYLRESVMQSIENYIDEEGKEDDWEESILAKTTLIHEAQKALAEENMSIPSTAELSKFTKIPEQEIEDILRLSKEKDS